MTTPHEAALIAAYAEQTAQQAWTTYVATMLNCRLAPQWNMGRVCEAWDHIQWCKARAEMRQEIFEELS